MLLIARALDGLASAAIGPMALAPIAGAFNQAKQARVIGLFLWLSGLGAALGPLGAALVVQAHGWLSGFLMPAAVAALGGFGVFLFAGGNGAKTESRRLDGIGALTCAAGLLGLVFRNIQMSHLGLLCRRVLQFLAVSIGALLAFVWWERGARDPLLDVRSFAIASYLWPSQPVYGRTGGRGRPPGRPPTTAIFPANRAKGEPDLGDCTAHAPDGCRHRGGLGRQAPSSEGRTGQSGAVPRSGSTCDLPAIAFPAGPLLPRNRTAAHRPGAAANGSRTIASHLQIALFKMRKPRSMRPAPKYASESSNSGSGFFSERGQRRANYRSHCTPSLFSRPETDRESSTYPHIRTQGYLKSESNGSNLRASFKFPWSNEPVPASIIWLSWLRNVLWHSRNLIVDHCSAYGLVNRSCCPNYW
jgi:hypothetical protein